MEKHSRYIIIMTKEGIFKKAASVENVEIGDEVYFKPIASEKSFFLYFKKQVKSPVRIVAMVCMLLLVVMPLYFIMGKNKTYAYINLEINPSVELIIDESLHVHRITPLNDDADQLVKKLTNYKNKYLEKVIAKIMMHSEEAGLVKHGKNMLIGVSFVNEEAQNGDLIKRLQNHLSDKESGWGIATFQVPKKIREKAQKNNQTMNETMALEIDEKNMVKNNFNEEDKEMIQSFYQFNEEKQIQEPQTEPVKDNNL